jgi:prolyl 4-hydroxylase
LYGIRVYTEGSILATHVDRLPLVSSAIINVAQDLDEPWPIEVYGHDGKATNVTMEPGDMVLYESHSVLHGRPFPLKGRYYANIFVHFEPVGHSLRHKEKLEQQKRDASEIHNNEGTKETLAFQGNAKLPPYILPGTPEEAHWRLLHPTGPVTKKMVAAAAAAAGLAAAVGKTTAVNPISQPQINQTTTIMTKNKKASNIHFAAQIGDLTTIQRAVEKDKSILGVTDANGWTPLHESARAGHKEIVRYLFEAGADINAKTDGGSGGTVMWLAKQSLGEDHELISYLESLGALDAGPDL